MMDFLFGPYPLTLQPVDHAFFYLAIASLLAGIVLAAVLAFRKINPVTRRLMRRFRALALTFGIVGLLLTAFRYENALHLNWRFWPILLIVATLIWKVSILRYVATGYKEDMRTYRATQAKQKYLKR